MSLRERLRAVLESPFFDFAPWIAMSTVVGPDRFGLAAALALATALAIFLLDRLSGRAPKLLDVAGVVFFAALLVLGLLAGESLQDWLERWAGDVSDGIVVLIALGSLAVRRPFTLPYAYERVERRYWDTPLFMRVNYVVSWVWTGAFALTALAGVAGDGPLGEPDNLWTNWIVQIGLLIFALSFSDWYPDVAYTRAGEREQPAPALRELLLPLAGYLIPVGAFSLWLDAAPWWAGAALIALGLALTRLLRVAPEPSSGAPGGARGAAAVRTTRRGEG
jgi:hypothetical protein